MDESPLGIHQVKLVVEPRPSRLRVFFCHHIIILSYLSSYYHICHQIITFVIILSYLSSYYHICHHIITFVIILSYLSSYYHICHHIITFVIILSYLSSSSSNISLAGRLGGDQLIKDHFHDHEDLQCNSYHYFHFHLNGGCVRKHTHRSRSSCLCDDMIISHHHNHCF